jgi:hypothetical protein
MKYPGKMEAGGKLSTNPEALEKAINYQVGKPIMGLFGKKILNWRIGS